MLVALSAAALVALVPSQADARSCAWTAQISGDQINALYPDQAARYWVGVLPLPPGGKAVLRGRFPHARYLSFNTYTTQTQAIDAVHDAQLVPDRGSSNPFRTGARRTVRRRAYHVTVVKGRAPATGAPANTIYTENADGSKTAPLANVAIRIYEPDVGRDITGGEPLPSVDTYAADGTHVAHYPECPDTTIPDGGQTQTLANSGPAAGTLPGPSPFARNPPAWHKYVNAPTALNDQTTDNEILGPVLNGLAGGLTSTLLPTGGFGENVDNKYIYALAARDLGAVLVLRGRMPTYPATFRGQPRMGTGQVRYWSVCTVGQATQYYACHNDDQVPLRGSRQYTIALSTSASRPRNATSACGVSWLPTGPVPQTAVIVRNMLANRSFAQSIQNVEPGHEAQQMGAYYPRGTYYATPEAADRALGCRRTVKRHKAKRHRAKHRR